MDRGAKLRQALADERLMPLGHFAIDASDDLPLQSGTVIMVGPDEPTFWPHFTRSPIYHDGQPDPLDRWSQAVLDPLAAAFDAHALYPFGGPPWHPFYSWALRTGRAWASPIRFLIHDAAGLFVSYRAALAVPWDMPPDTGTRPCDTCPDQPCATACPVDALKNGYDVDACKAWLDRPDGAACTTMGCAARRACPVGQGRRLPEQAAFHMEAFR